MIHPELGRFDRSKYEPAPPFYLMNDVFHLHDRRMRQCAVLAGCRCRQMSTSLAIERLSGSPRAQVLRLSPQVGTILSSGFTIFNLPLWTPMAEIC
jgi:hypothetical protein